MKKVTFVVTFISTLASLTAITCLAQSFMNYGSTPSGTSSSAVPKMAPGGKIATLSADDFKSRVTTLGRKNQEKLAQQVQEMIPPSPTDSGASSTPTASKASSTSTTPSSPTTAPGQPAAAPAAPQHNYQGFGTGTGSSAPASSGSSGGSSGSGGFGIKY